MCFIVAYECYQCSFRYSLVEPNKPYSFKKIKIFETHRVGYQNEDIKKDDSKTI